jgi:lactoylglutathione lyase
VRDRRGGDDAGMRITSLNHVALHVGNLGASSRFYRDVLGLTEIPRPAFDFPGAWYAIGPVEAGQELHLIARPPRDTEAYSVPRERHFAMAVEDAAAAEAALRAAGIAFQPARPRPDGVLQVFVRDPDGHVVELCQLRRPPSGGAA